MSIDLKKFQAQVEETARKAVLDAANRAKRSLGADGQKVQVKELKPPRRNGHNITYAEYSFPSEEVRDKFEKELARNLK